MVMRKIELTYQKNVRDIGGMVGFNGMKVKERRIYRGGFLGHVTSSDVKTINSLKLTDIVDFRSEEEFSSRPDYPFMGVKYYNIPVINEELQKDSKINNEYDDSNLLWFLGDSTDGYGHMCNIYKQSLTTPFGANAYKEFFKVLLKDNNRVVYFHCSQGKDRAGLAAYLLEIALGVSHEDAVEDYLLTNEAMKPRLEFLKSKVKDKPFFNKEYSRAMDEVFAVNIDYLNSAIDEVKKQYGTVLEYIEKVLQVDVDKLREIYLE